MPRATSASLAYDRTGAVHTKQGLALNYDPAATVHSGSSCVMAYEGCTDPTALNYDKYATYDDGSCWTQVSGCLETTAINYGCRVPGTEPCPSYLTSSVSGTRVTGHVQLLCSFVYPSPPSPPSPATPPGVETVEVYQTKVEFTSTALYTADEEASLKTNLASTYSAEKEDITIDQVADTARRGRQLSTTYTTKVTIKSDSEAAMNSVGAQLASDMTDLESAQNIFGSSVASLPTVVSKAVTVLLLPPSIPPIASPPPSSSDGLGIGVIVGIVIGALAGVAIIAVIIFCVMKKKKGEKSVGPAY